MIVVRSTEKLKLIIENEKSKGKKIGFVPTMGFLHEGHVSLITQSLNHKNFTVCSIFVNPTQFNDPKDLERYPRNESRDLEILNAAGCHLVFIPDVKDIYPEKSSFSIELGELANKWEGKFRPGHFNGVAQVVKILFDKVKPDVAYFGEKDFQQVLIIEKMCQLLQMKIEIKRGTIIRENDGLAMSSRNSLLSIEERKAAAKIPMWLKKASQIIKSKGVESLIEIQNEINSDSLFKLEYLIYCNVNNLNELKTFEPETGVILFAGFCGKIRLIDNLRV